MRARSSSTCKLLAPGDDDKTKLSNLVTKDFPGVERMLILDVDFRVRFLIYKSMVDKYMSQFVPGATPPSNKAAAEQTLKDLVAFDAYELLFENSFGFVRETATLADAKSTMDKQTDYLRGAFSKTNFPAPDCGDVFVTRR